LYELTIAKNAKIAKESKLSDANCQRVKIEKLDSPTRIDSKN